MDTQKSTDMILNSEDNEERQIRAYMRERFLRFLAKISYGEEAEFYTKEHTTVSGNIRGFDKYFDKIAVENLKTPVLSPEKAILRVNDLVALKLLHVTIED